MKKTQVELELTDKFTDVQQQLCLVRTREEITFVRVEFNVNTQSFILLIHYLVKDWWCRPILQHSLKELDLQ